MLLGVGRTALLLAHTTLARGLVARAVAPALSTRSSSVCMQAQASRLTVLVPVADDSEEIETSCITDTLTRAGAEVVVASVMPELQVRMSRGLKVAASVDTWSHRVPPWGTAAAAAPCGRESQRGRAERTACCVPYASEAQGSLSHAGTPLRSRTSLGRTARAHVRCGDPDRG